MKDQKRDLRAEVANGSGNPSGSVAEPSMRRDGLKSSITTRIPSSRVLLEEFSRHSGQSNRASPSAKLPGSGAAQSATGGDEAEFGLQSRRRALVQELAQQDYAHPLSRVTYINGKLPFVEIADSPEGNRYLIQEFVCVDSLGKEQRSSGVVEVPLRRIPSKESGFRAGPQTSQQSGTCGCGHGDAQVTSVEDGLSALNRSSCFRKIGHSLKIAIGSAHDEQIVSVLVRLVRPGGMTITAQLEDEIARGRIQTRAEYEIIREQKLINRQQIIEHFQAPVAALIRTLGGKIQFIGSPLAVINVDMPAGSVVQLADCPAVLRLDLGTDRVFPEAGEKNGLAIEIGSQFFQYIEKGVPIKDTPYDGDGLTFAIIESTFVRHHPAFLKTSHPPIFRVQALNVCSAVSCVDQGTKPTDVMGGMEPSHGTAVAGMIFGDFTRGQPLTPNNLDDRRVASGFARRATGVFYEYSALGAGPIITAFKGVALQFPKPAAVNLSSGLDTTSDPDLCNGLDALSLSANDLFESGVLLVNSAGNESLNDGGQLDEFHNPSKCLVTSPGSAIGTFTVGNCSVGVPALVPNVRTTPMAKKSSRGGQPDDFAHGRGRSIIDLAAYGGSSRLLSKVVSANASHVEGGTSYAAPIVTASAIVLTDYYRKRLKSNLLDDPGSLYSNLLLMGDRAAGEGDLPTKISTGFDRNFGAGRLKMRRFDTDASTDNLTGGQGGMGVPFVYESSSGVIGANETVQIFLNRKNRMPKGIDIFKFVIWWYDRRHETLGPNERIVNLDIRLALCDNAWVPVQTLAESNSPFDNKERIFYAPLGGLSGKPLLLEISGVEGFVDNFDYGSPFPGKIRFYYSYFCESSSRPGPGLFFNPGGTGIEPENLP